MNVPISFPLDAAGFLSQECPVCTRRFKVQFGEGSSRPLSFCPYCRHRGDNCWWTGEQVSYIAGVAQEKAVAPLLDDFARGLKRLNRPGSALRVSVKHRPAPRTIAPAESDEPMQEQLFSCCGERVKHDKTDGPLFCVICGTETAIV